MKVKNLIKKGIAIVRTSDKDKVVKRVKHLLDETELEIGDLDAIISSIDGKLWDEEMKRRISEQSENKLWTMEELEQLYEDEIDALNAKIDTLQIDKEYLEQSNQELSAKTEALSDAVKSVQKNQYSKGLLRPCEENELYENEINEILLDTLSESLRTLKPGTRRHDVLQSILHANKYDGSIRRKQEEIKNVLKTEGGATQKVIRKLRELGIEQESEGKHIKFSYCGDKRYVTTLARTPSDARAGMNIANTIIDLML